MTPELFEILPTRGINQSLLFAVLIGLWVLFVFNELYGWVFTGLVVPGYLAAVLIVQPASGVAIIIEAILTYLIARGMSDVLGRAGAWHRFFGRERFFLILLLSVFVRQQSELWLLPTVSRDLLGMTLDAQQTFFGVGLVLVPLLANMFWTLNLDRGALQVGVPVALTWMLLAWVFLPLTNYDLSTIATAYEHLAASFLAGPKVYIILLCAAGLAAIANHRYGWEFGGVLVPGLLAVAWFTPLKLATTLGEALLLYLLVSALLMIPRLSSLNAEGSRRIVLVFTLAFIVKLIIGWTIGDRWPGLVVTDLFGFGYLMPSLIAAKMLGRHALGRVMLPTVTLSIVGFVVGNAVAGTIHWVRRDVPPPAPEVSQAPPPLGAHPVGLAAFAHVQATARWTRVDAEQRLQIARALESQALPFAAWLAGDGPRPRLPIALTPMVDAGVALADATGRVGAPIAWLRPGLPGPVLRVARPASDVPALAGAAGLCLRLECRGVFWAGREGAPPSGLLAAIPPDLLVELTSSAEGLARAPTTAPRRLALRPETLWALAALPAPRGARDAETWLAEQTDPALRRVPRRRLDRVERALARQLAVELLDPLAGPHLGWVAVRAALIGHGLTPLTGCGDACRGLGAARAGMESVAFITRPTDHPLILEVPTPALERGTWRFGFAAWRANAGRALLVAAPRLLGGIEQHLPRPTRAGSLFHAVHAAWVGAHGASPGLIVQVRGRGAHRPGTMDAVVALEQPVLAAEQIPLALEALLTQPPFRALRSIVVDDGSAANVDLVFAPNAQRALAIDRGDLSFARVWLSESARAPFLNSSLPDPPAALTRALGPVREQRAAQFLATAGDGPTPRGFDAAVAAVERYVHSRNPLSLSAAVDLAAEDPDLILGVARHPGEGRSYFWLGTRDAGPRAVLFGPGPVWRASVAPPDLRGLGGAVVRP